MREDTELCMYIRQFQLAVNYRQTCQVQSGRPASMNRMVTPHYDRDMTSAVPDADFLNTYFVTGGELRLQAGSGDSDSLRRITDAVSRVLQVKNLSVLIGAGASYHLGSPRIRTMSRADLTALLEDANASLDEKAWQVLGAISGDGPYDLENLIATLSTALSYLKRTGGTEFHIADRSEDADTIVSLRDALNRSLAHACDLPRGPTPTGEDPLLAHKNLFRRLLRARRPELPRVRIFTTNYDLLIEKSLDAAGIAYFDGFAGTIHRTFQPDVFDRDLFIAPGADAAEGCVFQPSSISTRSMAA